MYSASIVSKGLNIGLNHLLHPYLVYASSEDSGETAHLRMLAWALVARQCDKNSFAYESSFIMLLLTGAT